MIAQGSGSFTVSCPRSSVDWLHKHNSGGFLGRALGLWRTIHLCGLGLFSGILWALFSQLRAEIVQPPQAGL